MIAELDTIVLRRNVPEYGLAAGDVGAVVYRHRGDAFEVEFVTGGGETVALLTLTAGDLRPIGPTEILHARELALP
jgi:Domain of unknown function (DUF4926)